MLSGTKKDQMYKSIYMCVCAKCCCCCCYLLLHISFVVSSIPCLPRFADEVAANFLCTPVTGQLSAFANCRGSTVHFCCGRNCESMQLAELWSYLSCTVTCCLWQKDNKYTTAHVTFQQLNPAEFGEMYTEENMYIY